MINDNSNPTPQGTDTMPPKMKFALAELEQPIEAQDAVEVALAEAAAEIESEVHVVPTRIKKARDWAERMEADLAPQEQELQTKLAAADAAYEAHVTAAQTERDRIKADVAADLKQVTALRAATAVFQGELRKAEL